jgi:hypothetical protein
MHADADAPNKNAATADDNILAGIISHDMHASI